MRYERQIVLREWGTAGQVALETASAVIPCGGRSLDVAERYLHAAGVARVEGATSVSPEARPSPFVASMIALPWHAPEARAVGLGAAHAVDFLTCTLREVPR